jgi:hypothetical protein
MTNRNDRIQAQAPLRPIGVALAAVVAGIGVAKAEAAPAPRGADVFAPQDSHSRMLVADPTNHPDFERDDSLILGESAPVEPFSAVAPAAKKQGDLFDL